MSALTEQIKLDAGDHGVHFYADEVDLSSTVGAYLAEGLHRSERALVIATSSHLNSLRETLGDLGIDAEDALQSGRLIVRDATETLSALTVDGQIDAQAFERVVGSLLRDTAEEGSTVRAYGEMVDLLWQAGDVDAAVRLETLWSELVSELGFALLCTYHATAVEAPEHEHALHQVRRLHSKISPWSVRRDFPAELSAPGAARRFLDETLRQHDVRDSALDDARLLLTELVANAVVHAHSPVSVTIALRNSRLRLAVSDASSEEPAPQPISPDARRGRGLQIVAALSEEWGTTVAGAGKTVWAELAIGD